MSYTLVGKVITIKETHYQRISQFDDEFLTDGWVDLSKWNGERPLYIFTNQDLGLDYMGRRVNFELKD